MTDWHDLENELEQWAKAGQSATLWWRDDDAVSWTPALAQLAELSSRHQIPLALAIIPAHADADLAERLKGHEQICVLQHGFAHTNHAPKNQKKSEFGDHRPLKLIINDLTLGIDQLTKYSSRVLAFVPPWNRIDDSVMKQLPKSGIKAVSTFGPRRRALTAGGLAVVNTHVDIIDWRGSRGFVGEAAVLRQLVDHLRSRRKGEVDASEPTGLLTHHLVHDKKCWQFLEQLMHFTRRQRAVCWCTIEKVFAV